MSRPTRSWTAVAGLAAALVLALAGCGSDSEPSADPTPSASSPAQSDSASASPSEEPSATSTVAPATGPVVEIEGIHMNAPEGWKPIEDIVKFMTEANAPTGVGAVRLGALAFPGTPPPIDELVRIAKKASDTFKRQPDIEVAGETFYRLAGQTGPLIHTDKIGTVAHGYDVTILFDLSVDLSPEEREQIIQASLATFAWE